MSLLILCILIQGGGSYGVLFSGIFLIAVVLILSTTIISIKKRTSKFIKFLIPIIATILIILVFDECWWARYLPQLYFMSLLALLMLEYYNKSNFIKYVKNIILLVFIINLLLHSLSIFEVYKTNYIFYKDFKNELKNSKGTIYIDVRDCEGAIFNVTDLKKDYAFIKENMNLENYNEFTFLFDCFKIYTKE